MINLATRAYDRRWRLDPIIRSLLDTDFYKLLMLQVIWLFFPNVIVTFELINRTKGIDLFTAIGRGKPAEGRAKMLEQIRHVMTLRVDPREKIWLAGNTFYGKAGIFRADFLTWLCNIALPEPEITADGRVRVTGTWTEVMLWEIYLIVIANTLRNRAGLDDLSELQLDVMYSRAKVKLWQKLERLSSASVSGIADFSTRRRHDFLFQEWAVLAAVDCLGDKFIGTSNVSLAMKHGLEAIGTNAHELPMVLTALANTPEEMRAAQYKVLELWQQTYDGRLKVFLPDTYGTSQFLANAPDWVADWTGLRVDSKDPFEAGEEAIAWWQAKGRDPRDKLVLFSDGLDVNDILAIDEHFKGRCRLGYGWGTLFGNDLRGCDPLGRSDLDPMSLVCKVVSVRETLEAVLRYVCKLSDNDNKPTGDAATVALYRETFGRAGVGSRLIAV